jgi:3'(2'), 5'-bisphosphate nucleotidase
MPVFRLALCVGVAPVTVTQDFVLETPTEDVLAIARRLAWGATKILRAYYRGESSVDGVPLDLDVQELKDGPVTAADLAVNRYVLAHLHTIFGHSSFGYLSEETYKTQGTGQALPQEWVWILDPLDGTRDFIDRTGEYAFHLALTHQGRPVISVVACPEAERVYYASQGHGAFVETMDGETRRLQVREGDRPEALKVVASRTHRDARFNHLLTQLPCQDRLYVGSVGGKIAAIVEGKADVYLSLSGKSAPKDWDMAAPELILTEAGGCFTYFDETPLRYNRGDVNQWGGLMASNGPCHSSLCQQAVQILQVFDAGVDG